MAPSQLEGEGTALRPARVPTLGVLTLPRHPAKAKSPEKEGVLSTPREGVNSSITNAKTGKGKGVFQFHQQPMEDDLEYFPANKFITVVEMYESVRPMGKASSPKNDKDKKENKEKELDKLFHLDKDDDEWLTHRFERASSAR